MARLFLPIAAVAALLAAVSAAQAAPAIPETKPLVRVELDLAASNGFEAHLETSEKGVATLRLLREDQGATYSTGAQVNEEGLKVRFGRLGLIDVAFTPTVTLNSTEPGEGCTGKPRTLREGVFAGKIEFRGERGYVQIEAQQTEGSMSVISGWECPEPEGLAPFANRWGLLVQRLRAAKGKREESASLYAAARRCACLFGAGVRHRRKGGGSTFFGAKGERRERMQISRFASVEGKAAAFIFDHAKGTATLRPPPPFSGTASFEERPGRDLWRSTIQVPLPGTDPLRTDGPGFQASLSREYSFD